MYKLRKSNKAFSQSRSENSNEASAAVRIQQRFWTTKQAVIKKLGKDDDQNLISSDSALDKKLGFNEAVVDSIVKLLRVLESYHGAHKELSEKEDALGMFLKTSAVRDKDSVGELLFTVGRYFSLIAKKRSSLENILVRLYEELETFLNQAVGDISKTIGDMEKARTTYRGSLLWMKDCSKSLNPDHAAQLKNFKKIQSQVRKNKMLFDDEKLKTMQKVDLLAFSRLNIFSKNLFTYTKRLSDSFRVLSDSSRSLVNASMAGNMTIPYHDDPTPAKPESQFPVPAETERPCSEKKHTCFAKDSKSTCDPVDLITLDEDDSQKDQAASDQCSSLLDDLMGGADLFMESPAFQGNALPCCNMDLFASGVKNMNTNIIPPMSLKPMYLPSVLLENNSSDVSGGDCLTSDASAAAATDQSGLSSLFNFIAEFDPLQSSPPNMSSGDKRACNFQSC